MFSLFNNLFCHWYLPNTKYTPVHDFPWTLIITKKKNWKRKRATNTVLFCRHENRQVRPQWMAILSAVPRRHLLPLTIKITARLEYNLLLNQTVIVTDMLCAKFVNTYHNSSALGDVIWHHWFWSTLIQVMTWYLMTQTIIYLLSVTLSETHFGFVENSKLFI